MTFKGAAWTDPSVDSPLASHEGIERLREILPFLERAVGYACEYVIADLLIPANANASHALNFEFLQTYLVPPCRNAMDTIAIDLRTAAPLESLAAEIQDMLRKYALLVSYIVRVGVIVFGEDRFYSSEGYSGLFRRHKACVDELVRVRRRSDISMVAADVDNLARLLSRAPTVPPVSTATTTALEIVAVEDREESIVHLVPVYLAVGDNNPGGTMLSGNMKVKVTNHDSLQTEIQRIWLAMLDADGVSEVLPLDTKEEEVEGDLKLPARSTVTLELTYSAVFDGITDDVSRLRLCVKAAGMGTTKLPLPNWLSSRKTGN